ncbi:MAG: extracellular solute-binding protein [Acetobacteraceae bacterium]
MRARAAAADLSGKTVVFASWGGAYQDAEKACYCDPFAAATGARVVQDGPMNAAKFRTMIESGSPDWDVADVTIDFLYNGVGDHLFEKIDTSLVDTSRIDPRFVHEYGIGCIVWSYNLGYSTKAFPGAAHPQSWADLFDLKRFPGKRTLNDNVVSSLEVALLADGVTPRSALSARCRPRAEEAGHDQGGNDLVGHQLPVAAALRR